MVDTNLIQRFLENEDGAATIDMVVLTAAGVATAVSLTNSVRDTMSDLVIEVGTAADAVNLSTSFAGSRPGANN